MTGRIRLGLLIALLPGLLLSACASTTTPDARTASTFLLVRHAEKATDDPKDPALTPAGEQRAARLSQRLADVPLSAVYSSDYRRTRQTATPTADRHGVEVTIYDAAQPADTFAASLRERHPAETVLVVGHSNTIPQLMAALCKCTAHVIGEDDYGDLLEIRLDADGRYSLRHDQF